MPAQKKTSLGLNQWIGSEYPKRIDFVEDNKNEIMQNEHSKYLEDLKKSYGKEVIENKRDYKKLKFVNEIYVEPNIHDGTGFKKKTNY